MTSTRLRFIRHEHSIDSKMQTATARVIGRRISTSRLVHALGVVAAVAAIATPPAPAANTEPTFALTRATATRGTSGRATLVLEGSFGVADAVQLDLPLEIVVTQGTRSARFDLAGNVSVSLAGAPAQAAPAPGVLGITSRSLTLVLPAEFTSGEATAQIVGTYDGESVNSNQLRFTL